MQFNVKVKDVLSDQTNTYMIYLLYLHSIQMNMNWKNFRLYFASCTLAFHQRRQQITIKKDEQLIHGMHELQYGQNDHVSLTGKANLEQL